MNIHEFRSARDGTSSARDVARTMGRILDERFAELLGGIRPGEVDPALQMLAGSELGSKARRTKWSTLVVNPGSTSTKVAIYAGLSLVADDEVSVAPNTPDGVDVRTDGIVKWVESLGLDFANLTGVAARGGFVAPVPMATYRISAEMCEDLENAPHRHASNMAVPIALRLGELAGPDVVLTITDPVTCDDLETVYRLTGSKKVRTDGTACHYLNTRAVCELTGNLLEVDHKELHLIACHMGGGMSAVRYCKGRMVQVLPAFGTFPSANRSGALPFKDLLRLEEERRYDFDDLKADVVEGKGGLLALTGTNDFRKLFTFASLGATPEQKEKIELVTEFYACRVASGIMQLAATELPLDGILLTGGLAKDAGFCARIADKIPIAVPVSRVPGSLESQSLAAGLFRAAADPVSRHNYAEARDALALKRQRENELMDVPVFDDGLSLDEDEPLDTLEKIIEAARAAEEIPTVAIVGGDNEEALLAAKLANSGDRPMARFVFIGSFSLISELSWELDIPIDEEIYFIVDSAEPALTAMALYKEGMVDAVMKGSVSTAKVLKGYLKIVKAMGKLKKGAVLSHIGLCDLQGKKTVVAVTDAAINPEPDLETRAVILENAVEVLKTLGFKKPKVAVIAPSEKPSAKVASTLEGEALAKKFAARDDVLVEGPISVDLALSPDSAEDKKYKGRIQGDADILLVPNLDVGNAVYKSFTITGDATVGGAVVGCGAPLILTSRGDTSMTKFASIALALVLAKRGGNK